MSNATCFWENPTTKTVAVEAAERSDDEEGKIRVINKLKTHPISQSFAYFDGFLCHQVFNIFSFSLLLSTRGRVAPGGGVCGAQTHFFKLVRTKTGKRDLMQGTKHYGT